METVSSKDFQNVLLLVKSMLENGKTEEVIRLLENAKDSSEKRKELINIANKKG